MDTITVDCWIREEISRQKQDELLKILGKIEGFTFIVESKIVAQPDN